MCGVVCGFFFFFKQKTAYEIVSGDWSSDVCSSDLARLFRSGGFYRRRRRRGKLGGGRRSCARRGLLMRRWIGGALGRRQQLVNNLSRGRFADGAIAVPDPALRERVLAPAGARLGVEFVKRDGSLLRRQLGQIDTGK